MFKIEIVDRMQTCSMLRRGGGRSRMRCAMQIIERLLELNPRLHIAMGMARRRIDDRIERLTHLQAHGVKMPG